LKTLDLSEKNEGGEALREEVVGLD